VDNLCRWSTTDNLKSAIANPRSSAGITITSTGRNVQCHHVRALWLCSLIGASDKITKWVGYAIQPRTVPHYRKTCRTKCRGDGQYRKHGNIIIFCCVCFATNDNALPSKSYCDHDHLWKSSNGFSALSVAVFIVFYTLVPRTEKYASMPACLRDPTSRGTLRKNDVPYVPTDYTVRGPASASTSTPAHEPTFSLGKAEDCARSSTTPAQATATIGGAQAAAPLTIDATDGISSDGCEKAYLARYATGGSNPYALGTGAGPCI